MAVLLGVIATIVVVVVGEDGPSGASAPATEVAVPDPSDALPRDPLGLARTLAATTERLDAAIDRWLADGDPFRGDPPEDVTLLALLQQRVYLLLAGERRLASGVLRALPPSLRAEARDNVLARRELTQIRSVRRGPPPQIEVGPPQPAGVLLHHYERASRRFEVDWRTLAAVNFVESAFGRLRNRSMSGARGPMQFIPATWDAYGLGGDIDDPRDAILGAANYLHASGARRDEAGALYAYNPSLDYVSAIRRYSRRMRVDDRAFYAYYSWQVFVDGRRLTGPGT